MSNFPYIRSLGASEQVDLGRGSIVIGCSSRANLPDPVTFTSGVMAFFCSPAEAIALGDALIRMAHHYTAALAEYQASLGEQAVES